MANAGQQPSSLRPGEQLRREQSAGHRFEPESSKAGGIVSTVTEKVQDMASGAKDTVEEWGSAAADAACQVKQTAQGVARSAAHTAENLGEEVTTLIRRYPIPALALGFSVGFLLAQAMRRR